MPCCIVYCDIPFPKQVVELSFVGKTSPFVWYVDFICDLFMAVSVYSCPHLPYVCGK